MHYLFLSPLLQELQLLPLYREGSWESVQFSSFQLLSHVLLFATPWTAAHEASLSITNSQSLPKPMSIESVMPSNHLILCHPILCLPSVFPSIKVFPSESAQGAKVLGTDKSGLNSLSLSLLICKMVLKTVVMRMKWELVFEMLSPDVTQRKCPMAIPTSYPKQSGRNALSWTF